MWKEIFSAFFLSFLCLQIVADNICDTPCMCEESDNYPGKLDVSCMKTGLSSIPPSDSWPVNTYMMDVSHNNITALKSLLHQETIQILKITFCQLTFIQPSVFTAYPFLQQLDISENNLKDLHKDTFLGLEQLKVLNMSENNIGKLPDNLFDNLVQLEELKLSGNPIHYLEINAFKQLDNLIILDISNIEAHSLFDGIFHYTANLKVLDLSKNNFEEVPDNALKSAHNLKELHFNENKVKEIDENSFKDLKQLELLKLNEMPSLTIVKERAFSALKSLKVLEMKSNARLIHIDASAFDGIYNPADINSLQIKVLILKNNYLSTLDAYMLPWCQMQTLDLQGNPWFCDCAMKWIINCSFPAYLSTDLKCYQPPNLKGKYLNQLAQDEYICLHQMAPSPNLEAKVKTVAAITGLVLALAISIAVVLFVKRRKIKSWWSFRRRGQGAVYYVKAQTNPTDNADL